MLGRVSLDGAISDPFAKTNGIKQGCILGQILFCLVYAAMRDDATIVCELLYADECALEAHTQDDLQQITDRFEQAANNFRLTTNIKRPNRCTNQHHGNHTVNH